ncbi:hypothetical protein GOBAR_AA17601 [Gossypium barbadense]|uniref:Uncharacterized protein n=1 Tax=Gossypium barbadense TaxID=3634 RepID=A0A2P5XI70_GOSBA|nr:hypothetical protein GOBAR_AA17601 [Gossypium barbadense]
MLGSGQWGQEETRELIFIRGELERDFTAAKHNKTLWEIVSARMKDRGYTRTPDQCKSKWKNLLNRYKGKETSDPENGCQFPFFEELHAVFTERAKTMQRRLLEPEAGSSSTQAKKKPARGTSHKRKKSDSTVVDKSPRPNSGTRTGLQEMLREFFDQQLRMEMQWREMMEKRAQERQLFEQEWQQWMEKLERERLMVEKAWREREEEMRRREESRAERRDSLLTTLLNKLINDNN